MTVRKSPIDSCEQFIAFVGRIGGIAIEGLADEEVSKYAGGQNWCHDLHGNIERAQYNLWVFSATPKCRFDSKSQALSA
jgi:hypothetical protein